jgi:hypothetical protein
MERYGENGGSITQELFKKKFTKILIEFKVY